MTTRLWRRVALLSGVLALAAAPAGCGTADRAEEPAGRPGPDRAADAPGPSTHGAPGTRDDVPPNGPPNHADNRAWRQRHELSAADRAVAEDAAERIVEALTPLHGNGEYAPGRVASAIEATGFPSGAITTVPAGTMPGTHFGVHVGERGCVVGTMRPDRLSATAKGAAAEFGCLEPSSH